MNKMQALIKCKNLWSYLAITGSFQKSDYKPARKWAFECPCCMQAGAVMPYHLGADDSNRDCRKCILNGYAWKAATEPKQTMCLYDEESYFYLWDNSRTKRKRRYYAMQIVQACNRAIEDLLVHGKLCP